MTLATIFDERRSRWWLGLAGCAVLSYVMLVSLDAGDVTDATLASRFSLRVAWVLAAFATCLGLRSRGPGSDSGMRVRSFVAVDLIAYVGAIVVSSGLTISVAGTHHDWLLPWLRSVAPIDALVGVAYYFAGLAMRRCRVRLFAARTLVLGVPVIATGWVIAATRMTEAALVAAVAGSVMALVVYGEVRGDRASRWLHNSARGVLAFAMASGLLIIAMAAIFLVRDESPHRFYVGDDYHALDVSGRIVHVLRERTGDALPPARATHLDGGAAVSPWHSALALPTTRIGLENRGYRMVARPKARMQVLESDVLWPVAGGTGEVLYRAPENDEILGARMMPSRDDQPAFVVATWRELTVVSATAPWPILWSVRAPYDAGYDQSVSIARSPANENYLVHVASSTHGGSILEIDPLGATVRRTEIGPEVHASSSGFPHSPEDLVDPVRLVLPPIALCLLEIMSRVPELHRVESLARLLVFSLLWIAMFGGASLLVMPAISTRRWRWAMAVVIGLLGLQGVIATWLVVDQRQERSRLAVREEPVHA